MSNTTSSKTTSIADNFEDIPLASYDLIDLLVDRYPPRCIRSTETEAQAHRYAGAVQLVAELSDWKRRETE